MIETKSADSTFVKDICKSVVPSWEETTKKLSKSLLKKMATDVKTWRVGRTIDDPNTHSWRSIATIFQAKYPEFSQANNIVADNQISGMILCEAAIMKLKETETETWNP